MPWKYNPFTDDWDWLTGSTIQDADGDTIIQVEKSTDEDQIRFDTAGTQRFRIDASGDLHILAGQKLFFDGD